MRRLQVGLWSPEPHIGRCLTLYLPSALRGTHWIELRDDIVHVEALVRYAQIVVS